MNDCTRRDLLKAMAGLVATPALATTALAAPALVGLPRKGRVIAGGFVDDGGAAGHRVRDAAATRRGHASPRPARTRRVRVAIVGGGIGGLSAGWQLDAEGLHDWTLLELESVVGGNTRSAVYPGLEGRRAPWGAHYLPIPDADAVHVRRLMRELGVLDALGQWDERVLCHAPQERVWQHGRWHEGLAPLDAASAADRRAFAQFESRIAAWRESGAFRVPSHMGRERLRELARGDAAARALARELRALDGLSADAWMRQQGWNSETLRWWVEYGTRDDYGASLQQASAWAAVHYFAARPADEDGPLTWPEGNDWIARQLFTRLAQRPARDGGSRVMTGTPVLQLESQPGGRWRVHTPQLTIDADAVIWAAPLFVLPRVLPGCTLPITLEHASWVVANLVLDGPPREGLGAPPSWDNVIYGSPSLGYVVADHQRLASPPTQPIWTWYHALVDGHARDARAGLLRMPWTHWRDTVLADLSRAHPDIAERVLRVDVMRWGHAMARPLPGVLTRQELAQAWQPSPGVWCAHADLSGFSLFEEAQWHGALAAQRVAAYVGGRS